MLHLEMLDQRFGAAHVLGGLCLISSALDAEGRILHLNELHTLVYGERNGAGSRRITAIASAFDGVRADARASPGVMHEMWEKWVFIAALAGITCLMRAPIGDIVGTGGVGLATGLLDECAAIATAEGFRPGSAAMDRSRAMLTAPESFLAASMFRDMERGSPIEGSYIVGDLLRRGQALSVAAPLLSVADAHLRAYEARRAREGSASP
jgi:2-dehydropantoate 2-reductase